MQPETHQSLKQSAIILGLVFAGLHHVGFGGGSWDKLKVKEAANSAAQILPPVRIERAQQGGHSRSPIGA